MAWFCRIIGMILIVACVIFFVNNYEQDFDGTMFFSSVGIIIGLLIYMIGRRACIDDRGNPEVFEEYEERGIYEVECPQCGEVYLSALGHCPRCDDFRRNQNQFKAYKKSQYKKYGKSRNYNFYEE